MLEQYEKKRSTSLPKKVIAKSVSTKVAPSAKQFVPVPKVKATKIDYGSEPLRIKKSK